MPNNTSLSSDPRRSHTNSLIRMKTKDVLNSRLFGVCVREKSVMYPRALWQPSSEHATNAKTKNDPISVFGGQTIIENPEN